MKKMIFTLKRQVLALVMLCCGMAVTAQSFNVQDGIADAVITAQGELAGFLNNYAGDKTAIIELKVSGTVNNLLNTEDVTALNDLTNLITVDFSGFTANPYDIPTNLLRGNTTVITFIFPPNTRNIGSGAFFNCALAGIINLPDNLAANQVIRDRFGSSQGITGFLAGENSTNYSTNDGVVFNKTATEIQFYPSGKADVSYIIPANTQIRNSAPFSYNNHLKKLTFGSGTTLQTTGRYGLIAIHSEIDSVFVAEGHTTFGSANGLLYELDTKRLVWSPKGRTEVRIPSDIEIIAGGGSQNTIFGANETISSDLYYVNGAQITSSSYTSSITLVDLPKTITKIQNGAFVGTSQLAVLISRATSVPVNYNTTFNAVGGNLQPAWSTKVYVPADALDDYRNSTWKDNSSGPNPDNPEQTQTFKGFNTNNFYAFYNIRMIAGTASSPLASDIAAAGQNVTITADVAQTGQVFDKWVATGVTIPNETDATATFTMPAGDVSITATYKADTSTGIENAENVKLILYPNPATESIQLQGANNTNYIIYSTLSSVVAEGTTNGETISVSSLTNGVYILKAEGKAIRFIKK